ncbi:hypothetical protein BHE74_00041515 [Ensete ventricosum]|nr:hypothetical protein GW17_00019405 [Ensete ventricosum]RWW52095.1 hypothetical protein BHE74_00041515 [Ensete ventricosum]RZS06461.1 hypothetical protein BHM03_00037115 [Ensete ventricosum]
MIPVLRAGLRCLRGPEEVDFSVNAFAILRAQSAWRGGGGATLQRRHSGLVVRLLSRSVAGKSTTAIRRDSPSDSFAVFGFLTSSAHEGPPGEASMCLVAIQNSHSSRSDIMGEMVVLQYLEKAMDFLGAGVEKSKCICWAAIACIKSRKKKDQETRFFTCEL